mmetsp:Transcript_68233/g.188829  ORF Transcript_68233/g.188829 Transcript_68233/m.188829 type:complete len:487 (-) Transcript_68233:108-1568(-)
MRARTLFLCVLSSCTAVSAGHLHEGDAVALVQSLLRAGGELQKKNGEDEASNATEGTVDKVLKERIAMLEDAKTKAIALEDFDLAKELKREIGVLLGESDMDRLRALKQAAIEDEDFDMAKDLKRRIEVLQMVQQNSSNGTHTDSVIADQLRAFAATGREPLPWGWRSARDPGSGLDYYWPVNDRAAVTWDRPTLPVPNLPPPGAAPMAAAPNAPRTAVRTTTPPPPFEVRSKDGRWSRCSIVANGTKPGTYNISVRSGKGWVELPGVPGTVIRNATDQVLLTPLATPRKAAANLTAPSASATTAMAAAAQVGDHMEIKTRSGTWVACVITGVGSMADTYNVHMPFAPAEHQDLVDIPSSFLRKATLFAGDSQKQEAKATPLAGSMTAYFMSDDSTCCVQGEPKYIEAKVAKLKASPLAEAYTRAAAVLGKCAENGFTEEPLPDVCLVKADLYLAKNRRGQPTPFESFLKTHGSAAVTQGLVSLCD